jgi:hypothetical protein
MLDELSGFAVLLDGTQSECYEQPSRELRPSSDARRHTLPYSMCGDDSSPVVPLK